METARVSKPTLPTSNSLLLCKGMLLQLFGFVTVYFVFSLGNCGQNLFWVFCPLDLGVSEFPFLLLVDHCLALRRQFCKHGRPMHNAPWRTYQTSNHCLVAANVAYQCALPHSLAGAADPFRSLQKIFQLLLLEYENKIAR